MEEIRDIVERIKEAQKMKSESGKTSQTDGEPISQFEAQKKHEKLESCGIYKRFQNVTFQAPPWFVTFKVATQAQLDNVLAAIPENVPFVIEIDDSLSREEISVPAGRRVSVLVPDGGTFSRRRNGLIISFY